MKSRTFGILAALVSAAAACGGCANDGSNPLSTASVVPDKAPAAQQMAAKVDPVCVSLSSQIDTLRKDEAVGRLEKASAGKSASVQVKRASLMKQAELNKANADFQSKCGPKIPAAQTAQAAPATVPGAAQVAPVMAAAAATTQAKAAATKAVTSAAQQAVAVAPKN